MRISVRTLFKPAIAQLNRLRYPYKFGLMGVGAAIAIAFFVVSLHVAMRGAISDTRAEIAGIKVYPAAIRLAVLSQQQMAFAVAVGAEPSLSPMLSAKTAEFDSAMAALEAALAKDGAGLDLGQSWGAFKKEWQALKAASAKLPSAQVMVAYQKPMAALDAFLGDLGERSSLISDADNKIAMMADILLRKLPEANLQAGRLQVFSIAPLQTKDMAGEWLKVAPQLARSVRSRAELVASVTRLGSVVPAQTGHLKSLAEGMQTAGAAIDQLVDQEIIKGGFSISIQDFVQQNNKSLGELAMPVLQIIPKECDALLQGRLHQLEQRFWSYTLGAGLMVMVLLYFAAGMFVTILQSVSELSEGAQRIAGGDLRTALHFSARDELRQVANQFNAMVSSFSAIIRQVHMTTESLEASSARLAESACLITEGTVEQSDASASMAAAVEELTVGIDEISRHAATAEEVSRQSGEQAAAGCGIVENAMREMDNIAEVMQESSGVISSLGQRSEQISEIVASIKGIADQTNMLALNASIEAARAGEEGKGFAVVADQVRGLAERTTQATQEIYAMVSAIQQGTGRAVIAMTDGVARVQQGVNLTRQAGAAMQSVNGESGKVLTAVSEISLALREQSAASTEIAKGVENIARMAEENREAVSQMSETAARLATLSGQLAGEVGRFRA